MPVATCVDDNQPAPTTATLPEADYVTTIHEYQPTVVPTRSATSNNAVTISCLPVPEAHVEVLPYDDEVNHSVSVSGSDCFFAPSSSSFVTPENEQYNKQITAAPTAKSSSSGVINASHTITGQELLQRLKQNRKKQTLRNGLIGGAVGFVFLGPVGLCLGGLGSAVFTKQRLKRIEKTLRRQLEGRLDQPLPILSRQHHCRCHHRLR